VRPHSSLGYLTPEEFATGYANVESKKRFSLTRTKRKGQLTAKPHQSH
jgi:hypothetical protein